MDIFTVNLGDFKLASNKRSDFIVDVEFASETFGAEFGEDLNIPEKYRNWLKIPSMMRSRAGTPTKASNIKISHQFKGQMKITPDGNKDIEFMYDQANIVVFSFMIRFIVELLNVDDIPEHPGFEELDSRRLSFLLRIKDAELCLVSNEESCIVVKSSLV